MEAALALIIQAKKKNSSFAFQQSNPKREGDSRQRYEAYKCATTFADLENLPEKTMMGKPTGNRSDFLYDVSKHYVTFSDVGAAAAVEEHGDSDLDDSMP